MRNTLCDKVYRMESVINHANHVIYLWDTDFDTHTSSSLKGRNASLCSGITFFVLLLCTYIFVPHESRTFDDCWCMTYSKNVLRNLMQNSLPRIVNDGPYLVSDD